MSDVPPPLVSVVTQHDGRTDALSITAAGLWAQGDGFVAAVDRLVRDRAHWERMRRACHALIGRRYSFEQEVDAWATLIREAAGGRRRAAIRPPLFLAPPPLDPVLASQDQPAPSLLARTWRQLCR